MSKTSPAHVSEESRKDITKAAHARRAGRIAALTTLIVAVFAVAFIGVVMALDQYGPGGDANVEEEIPIEVDDSETLLPSEPVYVLLIGSDTRKGTALYTGKKSEHAQVDQHSDIMTLVRIDVQNHTISLLSIPRDTVVEGQKDKINDALLDNKPEDVVDAVAELTGIRADYYMMTTFVTFDHLIDALGGIDVDVPKTIKVSNPATGGSITVKAGDNQHLNGDQALALARARKEYGDDGDVVRQMNVRAIEQAIIQKVLTFEGVIPVERLLAVVDDDVKTNMDMESLGLMILDFIGHADEVTFMSGTGPYEGGGERKSDGQWVIEADMKTWRQIALVFVAGGDPSTIVELPKIE